MRAAPIASSRLAFERFDEGFLEKSWHWLQDPEIKALTLTPDFTRDEQQLWFVRLPQMPDYRIWGISCDGNRIGAVGLKHIAGNEAEYWGYIGERAYWNAGLGKEMLRFIFGQAREMGLSELYLKVGAQNARALRLYTGAGFQIVGESNGVLQMRLSLAAATPAAAAFSVQRYSPERQTEWDGFLAGAKNATFLFRRDYMDYHRDRFADHSLLIFRGAELVALLPANRAKDGALVSHEGLTYGGLVVSRDATLRDVLMCFHAGLRYLSDQQISRLRYKRIPRFYNTVPDDEVDYAMFLLDARLYRRDCAVVISMADRLPLQERRRRQIRKARRAGIRLVQESDFAPFWQQVLAPRLESRYGVKPVHSVEEISLLASRFPENIKQFSAYSGSEIVAGTTLYETPTVAHAQYIATTAEGQKTGALDYLFGWLIDEQYKHKQYFDPGICNEKEGRFLNHGLMEWKEGFGGRTCVHDFYEINTADFHKLEPVLRD